MANGGLIATAGSHLLALAAQHASVPLVACAGLYKLTPLYPSGGGAYMHSMRNSGASLHGNPCWLGLSNGLNNGVDLEGAPQVPLSPSIRLGAVQCAAIASANATLRRGVAGCLQ